jgi:hypothetical protein
MILDPEKRVHGHRTLYLPRVWREAGMEGSLVRVMTVVIVRSRFLIDTFTLL